MRGVKVRVQGKGINHIQGGGLIHVQVTGVSGYIQDIGGQRSHPGQGSCSSPGRGSRSRSVYGGLWLPPRYRVKVNVQGRGLVHVQGGGLIHV